MNADDKNRIVELRKNGIGYGKIAQILGLNENSVKTYCRRNGLTGTVVMPQESTLPGTIQRICKQCGASFQQYPGHREKMFCCVDCRTKWWNRHQFQVRRKAIYDFICPTCGKKFSAYGNSHRKYCSRECYVIARFGVQKCR